MGDLANVCEVDILKWSPKEEVLIEQPLGYMQRGE